MPSEQSFVSVHLISQGSPQSKIKHGQTTTTATEIQPQRDSNPVLSSTSQYAFGYFQNALLVLGWQSMSVMDLSDGYELGTHSLPREPVLPPVIADFNGDGLNDVIVTTSKQ